MGLSAGEWVQARSAARALKTLTPLLKIKGRCEPNRWLSVSCCNVKGHPKPSACPCGLPKRRYSTVAHQYSVRITRGNARQSVRLNVSSRVPH